MTIESDPACDENASPLLHFPFVTDSELRSILERDYLELVSCVACGNAKSAVVLAGSIIEAFVVDYLLAAGGVGKSESQLLKLSLGDLVDLAVKNNLLADKTEHLSHAVRDYRNLVHPGREKRLGSMVCADDATVASALVRIVAAEIAVRRAENIGATAEQVVQKARTDPTASIAIDHLIRNMKEPERRRLLLEALPEAIETDVVVFPNDAVSSASSRLIRSHSAVLRRCALTALTAATAATKKATAKHLLGRVRSAPGETVLWTEYVFLSGDILDSLSPDETALVVDDVVQRVRASTAGSALLPVVEALLGRLDVKQVEATVTAIALLAGKSAALRNRTSSLLATMWYTYPSGSDKETAFKRSVDGNLGVARRHDDEARIEVLEGIQSFWVAEDDDSDEIPF